MPNSSFTLGAVRDPNDQRDYRIRDHVHQAAAPSVVDYEAQMSAVKDQGNRGSCVAHGACAVKEWQEAHQRGFEKEFDLSEEWLYHLIALPDGGAYPRDVMKALARYGVCEEKRMPYDKKKSDISEVYSTSLHLPMRERHEVMRRNRRMLGDARKYRCGPYVRLRTIDELKEAAANAGPLLIGIPWFDGWYNTRGKTQYDGYPILKWGDGNIVGRHLVAIAGYQEFNRITDILTKFKNSWNTRWGKNGYAYFLDDIFDHFNSLDIWAMYDQHNPLILET
tara:strand:+ start:4322 stop:5158 length:837 start_codon:yes stop_codon:yes gene_type:complete